ncbi:MAG: hypothetical protein HRT88_02740 [Lentisphaeraceae bacterium]|nr:hypothetical protein [Lentisphaeraceae bacterium]
MSEKSFFKRFLLTCNPWFLASTVLILFGIYSFSNDSAYAGEHAEVTQPVLSFVSLQIYEVLALAAALIFRKWRQWHDSVFLLIVGSLLIFIPFLTLSKAIHLEVDHSKIICLVAVSMALVKMACLKVIYKNINLPWELLRLGGLMLILNSALPFVVEQAFVNGETQVLMSDLWLYWLPLISLFSCHMLSRLKNGEYIFNKKSLPVIMFSLWFTMTILHLFSINFVYDLQYSPAVNSMLFYIVVCFCTVLMPTEKNELSQNVCFVLMSLTPFVFIWQALPFHFSLMLAANVLLFIVRKADRRFIHWQVLCLGLQLFRIPAAESVSFGIFICGALLLFSLMNSLKYRNWVMSFSVVFSFCMLCIIKEQQLSASHAFIALSFVIFHGGLWSKNEVSRGGGFYVCCLVSWVIVGIKLTSQDEYWLPTICGSSVALCAWVYKSRQVFQRYKVFYVALLVGGCWPLMKLLSLFKDISRSLIIVFSSLLVFTGGFVANYRKRHQQIGDDSSMTP